MEITLNRLDSNSFEQIVQSLSQKIIGNGIKVYGKGPDGQRECTFEGEAPFPSVVERWSGYWILQAKFKGVNTKENDFQWLKKELTAEIDSFKKKKLRNERIPDNYLFFTNIVLTPVGKTGIKDKIDAECAKYKDLVKNICIIGYDEIRCYLENNRDVAISYASLVLSGDCLFQMLHNQYGKKEKEESDAISRFIAKEFKSDLNSKVDQAGSLSDKQPELDKVFIDLDVEDDFKENGFISFAISQGNYSRKPQTELVDEKLNRFKKIKSSNKYVLKGHAGQGKSTICQLLSQIYRAYFLKEYAQTLFNNSEIIKAFVERIEGEHGLPSNCFPKCLRVPIKIVLRDYAAYISKEGEGGEKSLLSFISTKISKESTYNLSVDRLRYYLRNVSWVFFLDGLDEVPESSNRGEVMEGIETLINIELAQANCDCLFFSTTRPEGYSGEFNSLSFSELTLQELSPDKCKEYLQKLLNVIEPDMDKRERDLQTLKEALKNPQTSEIMRTPLNATIMALLVRTCGEPPKDKFSLFEEYFNTIIRREQQKALPANDVLKNDPNSIKEVYYLLAYELQVKSSDKTASDARISKSELDDIIAKYLESKGYDILSPEIITKQNSIYTNVVKRICFASENANMMIGFDIRSLQEFLAAVYIARKSESELRVILHSLAKNDYWKNTFHFIVGYLVKNKFDLVNYLIDTVLNELNGVGLDYEMNSAEKSIFFGAQISIELLATGIFNNHPRIENKLCEYAKEYFKLESTENYTSIAKISKHAKKTLANIIAEEYLNTPLSLFLIKVILLISYDKDCLEILKRIINKNVQKIVEIALKQRDHAINNYLVEQVTALLNDGVSLRIKDLFTFSSIIKNAKLSSSKDFKQQLFVCFIKNIVLDPMLYDDENEIEAIKILDDYFNINVKLLIGTFNDVYPYFRNPSVKYNDKETFFFFPQAKVNEKHLKYLIQCCRQFNCENYAIIFEALLCKSNATYLSLCERLDTLSQDLIDISQEVPLDFMLDLLVMCIKQNKVNNIINFLKSGKLDNIKNNLSQPLTADKFIEILKMDELLQFAHFYAEKLNISTTQYIIQNLNNYISYNSFFDTLFFNLRFDLFGNYGLEIVQQPSESELIMLLNLVNPFVTTSLSASLTSLYAISKLKLSDISSLSQIIFKELSSDDANYLSRRIQRNNRQKEKNQNGDLIKDFFFPICQFANATLNYTMSNILSAIIENYNDISWEDIKQCNIANFANSTNNISMKIIDLLYNTANPSEIVKLISDAEDFQHALNIFNKFSYIYKGSEDVLIELLSKMRAMDNMSNKISNCEMQLRNLIVSKPIVLNQKAN